MRRRRINLSPAMSKAARALLDISQTELASRIDISASTIRRFEAGRGDMGLETKTKMVEYYKVQGLVFVYRSDEVIGVIKGDIGDIIFDY
jgi:DNA-binding XRE family transcriptional regulator